MYTIVMEIEGTAFFTVEPDGAVVEWQYNATAIPWHEAGNFIGEVEFEWGALVWGQIQFNPSVDCLVTSSGGGDPA